MSDRVPVIPIGVGIASGRIRPVATEWDRSIPDYAKTIAAFGEVPTVAEFVRFVKTATPSGVLLPPLNPYSHLAWAITYLGVVAGSLDGPLPQSARSATLDLDSGELVCRQEEDAPASRAVARARARSVPASGTLPQLLAQLQGAEDVPIALGSGADGVGEIRSELLFEPDGSTSSAACGLVATIRALTPWDRVPIRFWDSSPDKPWTRPRERSVQRATELGYRGVRAVAVEPGLVKQFMSALAPLSTWDDLVLVLPMVNEVEDITPFFAELPQEMGLGITVETPAAVWNLEEILNKCPISFVEIGLNDLTQYVTAWTRSTAHARYAPSQRLYPAVHKAILSVAETCEQAGVYWTLPVDLRPSISLASDLLRLGAPALTVSPRLLTSWRSVLATASRGVQPSTDPPPM